MRPLSDRAGRRLALALTLVAFGLFLLGADAKSLWWDESLSLHRAQQDLAYILSNRLDIGQTLTVDQHPPLYFVLLHGAIRLFGESDLALRLLSIIAATLCVPLLYALGKRLAGARVGVLAALWAALSPFYLWYAHEVRMYTLITALGAAGTYCLWRAADERRATWLAGYVATVILGMSTLYFYALLVGVQLLFGAALVAGRTRLRLRALPRWARAMAALLLLLLVGLIAWLAPPQLRALLNDPLPGRAYVPLGSMLVDALSSFALGLSVPFHELWPAQVVYLLPYLLGVAQVYRLARPREALSQQQRPWGAILTLLLGFPLLPLLFFWLVSLYKPIYMGSRYIIHLSPSFYLGLAWGIDALWRRQRWVGLALALALAGGMVYSTVLYHTDPLYVKEDYRSAAQVVMQQELPGDAIVLTAPENIFAFEHYYRGDLSISPLPQPPFISPDAEELDRALRLLAGQHERLWFVHCRPQWSDPGGLVQSWLDSHLILLQRTLLPSYGADMVVYLYGVRPLTLPEADYEPAVAACGEGLALLDWSARYLDAQGNGVTLDRAALLGQEAVAPAPGGEAIGVRLRWQVQAPLAGLKLSLRLVDEQGQAWAQQDSRPIYNWPTESWPVGSVVEHDIALTAPVGAPPGRYRLVLISYREADLQILPCASPQSADPALLLGEVILGPTPARLAPTPAAWAPQAERPFWPQSLGPLRLVGRSLEQPPDGVVSTGESLALALRWLAQEPLHGEYDLVVHWVQGRTVAHRQVLPLPGGARAQDEPLLVLTRLAVPDGLPAGRYTLRLLLYDRREGTFQRVRIAGLPWLSSSLSLGKFQVR